MAKKKRRFGPVEGADDQPKDVTYEDRFQKTVGRGVEGFGKAVEGRGRTILYIIGALVVVGIIVFVIASWSRRSSAEAQTALGQAIEITEARVTSVPLPAGSTEKTFKTEKERSDAAIAAFQKVVDMGSGALAEKAKYFIAMNKLPIDRPGAIVDLETLSQGASDTASLAKFALAQVRTDDGQFDQAAKLYEELAAANDPVVSKETINFNLAGVYQKLNKTKEAADLYYNIVKAASEAKNADGDPVQQTETAREAREKLTELAPDRAKEIAEPAAANPFGG
ncbi:MAG: tetratricopeptide repeat protein [Acidobacteria bacterium]|nr:tetratricopeptide repeat protein [Acidobacteriota bacterium]